MFCELSHVRLANKKCLSSKKAWLVVDFVRLMICLPPLDIATMYESKPFVELLDQAATIGTVYSFSGLSRFAAPLSETVDYGDGTPYEVFIE